MGYGVPTSEVVCEDLSIVEQERLKGDGLTVYSVADDGPKNVVDSAAGLIRHPEERLQSLRARLRPRCTMEVQVVLELGEFAEDFPELVGVLFELLLEEHVELYRFVVLAAVAGGFHD